MDNAKIDKKILTIFSELFINIELLKEQKKEKEENNRINNFKSASDFIEKYKIDKQNNNDFKFDTDVISKILLKCTNDSTVYRNFKTDLNGVFDKLYNLSEKENYFWHNCSLIVYQNHFLKFKNHYLKLFPTKSFVDFLEYELNYYFCLIRNPQELIYEIPIQDYFLNLEYRYFLNGQNKMRITYNKIDKVRFLKSKLLEEGYESFIEKNRVHIKKIEVFKPLIEKNHIEETLTKKDLPAFDVLDRYELIKELKIDKLIHNLDTSQRSKYKVLALLMGIHPESARKLMTNKYPKLKSKEEIAELCSEANNNVSLFFTNPLNNIKIP
jgi:hypothetical protein